MELQSALSALHVATDRSAVVAALQDITARLLRRGVFEVSGVECRPLELESYFYRTGLFEDAYVHENERQRNHFGELYVHRIGAVGFVALQDGQPRVRRAQFVGQHRFLL